MIDFHGDEAEKKLFFEKRKNKNDQFTKTEFFNSANSQYFVSKILGIGLVELIDSKGIDVAQAIWS